MAVLQDPWPAYHQNCRLTDQTTPSPNKKRKRRIRTQANHSRLHGGTPLMGTLAFIRTSRHLTLNWCIASAYTTLALFCWWRLIPVNSRVITSPPKMSLLLDIERSPTVIIKPRHILVMHTDHLSLNKTFNAHSISHMDSDNEATLKCLKMLWTILKILYPVCETREQHNVCVPQKWNSSLSEYVKVSDGQDEDTKSPRWGLTLFIIIIKRGRQCKAEREWYTPYQSEEPSPTIPTYRQEEEKWKNSIRI